MITNIINTSSASFRSGREHVFPTEGSVFVTDDDGEKYVYDITPETVTKKIDSPVICQVPNLPITDSEINRAQIALARGKMFVSF